MPDKVSVRASLPEHHAYYLRLRAALSGTTQAMIANTLLVAALEDEQDEIERQIDRYAQRQGIDRQSAIDELLGIDDSENA